MKNTVRIAAVMVCMAFISCNSSGKMDRTGYSGKDMAGKVEIIRDKATKTASIKIEDDTKWKLYAGDSVAGIGRNVIAEGERAGVFQLAIPREKRIYFQLVTPKSSAIMAERYLPMSGGYNFRDLGGYKTRDGRHVKWGKLFRSDELHDLTPEDLAYLSGIPLVSVVDFRSAEEISGMPDRLPASVAKVFAYSIDPDKILGIAGKESVSGPEEGVRTMARMYELFASENAVVTQYGKFFEILADEENLPLLFHCSAGKDRTGMAAALVLLALGVDEETVQEDYISSNQYLTGKYDDYIDRHPGLEPLMEVRPEYLQAGLDKMTETYGSVENYLENALGVDIEALRVKYLD